MAFLSCSMCNAGDLVAARDAAGVRLKWGPQITLRDGIHLNATAYLPKDQPAPAPCIVTLTPYIADTYHDRGVYFAAHGFPFLIVDVRGRGNSEGIFRPLIQESNDGYDVVEWLARQPYCNGKVAMWGGSYAGYDQWATAAQRPPHLVSIVPVAAAHPAVDVPFRNNIFGPYILRWLTWTGGHTAQDKTFADRDFWSSTYREYYESGRSFKELDRVFGNPSATWAEWVSHPEPDSYWDARVPTAEQYAQLDIPILTITGTYDADQPGALAFYREHMRDGNAHAKARHFLIIGPWDHSGTRTPKLEFGDITVGPASLVDLPKLHLDWYAWTLMKGPKPDFLKKPVAYYVMGTDTWRYADTLEAITERIQTYYLHSAGGSVAGSAELFASGSLSEQSPDAKGADHYTYDPRDNRSLELERTLDTEGRTDQRLLYSRDPGTQLVYHTAPFAQDTEISGFFKFSAWIAIDQKDTDFGVSIYEVGIDGGSVLLSTDLMRARYRQSLRHPQLIQTRQPLQYDFDRFTFVSRRIKQGSRMRLVLGPVKTLWSPNDFSERNYGGGGVVAEESAQDAKPVNIVLYHDLKHPSALFVPLGRIESAAQTP